MTKRLIIGILILMTVPALAQHRGTHDVVSLGIKGGGNVASYQYADLALDTLGFDRFVNRVRPMGGLSLEIPLGKYLFLAPEVMLVGCGDARRFESALYDTLVCYRAKTYYLESRLQLAVAIPVNKWMKPYLFAAPSFGVTMPMGGIQQYSLDKKKRLDHSVEINSGNMAPYDIGALVGGGMRFMIDFDRFSLAVKMEAAWHLGFLDTYSSAEHYDQSQALNVNAYNVKGERLNRGLEATVTVAMPLKILPGDACSGWSKGQYPTSRRGHSHSF